MLRAFLVSMAVCGMLIACNDGSGDVPSSPGEVTAAGAGSCPTDISDLIASLFPGGLENAATQQCNNIDRQLEKGEFADAVGKTFDLIGFVLGHYENGKLDDPDGDDTTDLVNALLALIGLDPLSGNLGDENVKVQLCEANTECVFTTDSEFAGFLGTFTEPTLVTIFLREDDPFGPLGVTAFPLIFDFSTMSPSDATGPSFGLALASSSLAEPATVAVCVVDPPDPEAPDEMEMENLALGRVVDEGTEDARVEILLDAPPGGFALNCTDASSNGPPEVDIVSLRWWGERAASAFEPVSDFLASPLLANPGERRGLITAFSPVGGIDTRTVGDENTGGISGTVSINEDPASGITVELYEETIGVEEAPIKTITSGSNGSYGFSDLLAGFYTVRAFTGCFADTEEAMVTAGSTTTVDLDLTCIE
ncbi:MAG: carboxypeptidase-like regulatory domain-containing protein [Vicinamibacteria bacterium]